MATKIARMGALGGAHTAGIYSDMTVDGPEIGTLVMIVDRAKNLPNRKTMGKQDPYCAARLGKEAKKTNTDKRGGQTPRWDQELRFTVHDSPDYHNLKVSVFNDDKKTELIGETWVNLGEVVVPGGGQSDTWHNLNCKGKYAGEIRIELTYYDNRPKPERPAAEQSPVIGAPRQNTPIKRRPLPSDPTGGSPSPLSGPDHARNPPVARIGPRSYPTPSQQDVRSQSPSNLSTPVHRRSQSNNHQPQPVDHRGQWPDFAPRHDLYDTAGDIYPYEGALRFDAENAYEAPEPSLQHMSRPYAVGHIEPLPQPSPLYSNHSPLRSQPSRSAMLFPDRTAAIRSQPPIGLLHSHSAPEMPAYHHVSELQQNRSSLYYDQIGPQGYNGARMTDGFDNPYNIPPSEPRYSRHDTRFCNEPDDCTHEQPPLNTLDYHQTPNQYQSPQRKLPAAMQPTVEDESDVPPPPPPVHRSSAPATVQLKSRPRPGYAGAMAPSPLSTTSARGVATPDVYHSPVQNHPQQDLTTAQVSAQRRYTDTRVTPRASYAQLRQHRRHGSGDAMMPSPAQDDPYATPHSLIPGYNLNHADDPSQRLRREHGASMSNQPSPSQLHQAAPRYDTPPSSQHEVAYANSPQYHPRHAAVHPAAPLIKPRAVSPDPQPSSTPIRGIATRKSLSPQPPEDRRLSGTPFSPDSFDAFNPNVRPSSHGAGAGAGAGASASAAPGRSAAPSPHSTSPYAASPARDRDRDRDAADGPIVGFHGNVIDPSDHLPVDSWAPEPERKTPAKATPARDRDRDRLTGVREPLSISTRSSPLGSSGPAGAGRPSVTATLKRASAAPPPPPPPPQQQASPSPLRERSGNGIGIGIGARSFDNMRERFGDEARSSRSRASYAGYSGAAPPPIPSKLPVNDGFGSEEIAALSQELGRIDIGPAERRGGGRWRGGR